MPTTAVTIIEAWEGNDTLSERGGALIMFPKSLDVFLVS
jgi:hypothetical protein